MKSATAYVVDDVVSLSGSSYVCIQAGTNQNPSTALHIGTNELPQVLMVQMVLILQQP